MYAQRHLAAPLRDEKGVATVVIDMNLGEMEAPSTLESLQIGRMMKLLTAANAEIVADSLDGQTVTCIGKSSRLLVSPNGIAMPKDLYCKVYVDLYSAFLRKAPQMRSDMDHTVLPANYTMPAFTPQTQNITALWLVLILPSHGGWKAESTRVVGYIPKLSAASGSRTRTRSSIQVLTGLDVE